MKGLPIGMVVNKRCSVPSFRKTQAGGGEGCGIPIEVDAKIINA